MASEKETRIVELVMNGSQAGSTIKNLSSDVRTLQAHIRGLTPGTKEFVDASKRLQETKARFKELNDQVNGVSKGVSIFKNQFLQMTTSVVGGNLITAVFEKIAGFIPNMISGAAKLSDELSDVQKTTGMSAEEAKKLNSALSKINTRTANSDLRQIAISAGQIGIAKEDILAFTEATDKLNVALGDEFTGGAEQVTKEIGALRNIFQDVKSDQIDKDMLHIGNALNALGAAGTATGPVVADFANRIGSVGITLGLSSAQVLGLSATLQELNVATERGGTAVTKILLQMANNTTEFAKVAGMSVTDFKDLVNNDLYGAFTKVVEGSQKSGSAATEFSAMLDNLGVDGAGASEVFAKLGANTDLLASKVELAGTSLTGTSSILSEFDTKNNNLAGNLEKMGKRFSSNVIAPISNGIGKLTEFFIVMMNEAAPLQLVLSDIFAPLREIIRSVGDFLLSLGLVTDQTSSARFMIMALAKAIQIAWMPFKLLTQGILLQVDAFRVLINEGKKAANFFGADFQIDPKLSVGKLINEVKDMGKTIIAPFQQLPEEVKKSTEEVDKTMETQTNKEKIRQKLAKDEMTKEQKKFNDNTKKLLQELAEVKAQVIADEEASEVAALAAKFQKRIEEVKNETANADVKKQLILALEEQLAKETTDIHAKYAKERAENDKNEAEKKKNEDEKALEEQKRKELEFLQLRVDYTKEGTQERLDAETALLTYKLNEELIKFTDNEEAKKLIREHYSALQAAAESAEWQKRAQQFQEYAGMVTSLLGSIDQIQTNNENAQLARDTAANNKKKENLQKQLEKKQISQETYNKREAALDEDLDKKKKELTRRQAERQKQLATFTAIINGAAAIMKIAAEFPKFDFGVSTIIAMGAQAILTGAQVAAIQSAPLPEYDKGGLFKVKGQSGKNYNATYGGRLSGYYSSPTLALVAENKPEYVVPNHMLQMPQVANMVGIMEGIRVNKQFDAGGSTSTSMPVQPVTGTSTSSAETERLAAAYENNTAIMLRLLQKLDEPIEARLSYNHLTETTTEIESTKQSAGIR